MRKLIATTVLLAALWMPTPAFAAEYEWTEDPPKEGLSGYLLCHSDATYGGHHSRLNHNVGLDVGQPSASEREWQVRQCKMLTTDMQVGVFKYAPDFGGLDLPRDRVVVTWEWAR